MMYEIIVSPIAFHSWQYLTKITAIFHDRAGVVRKLAHALKDLDLDLMYEESASIENGRFHRVEMLVDAQSIYSRFDSRITMKNHDLALLSRLERKLQATCLNELAFDGRRPRLKVRPMEGLRNAWLAYRMDSRVGCGPRTEPPRVVIERQGTLELPPSVLGSIDQTGRTRAVLVSDTKDRVLRVLLPHGDAHFTYIRVSHRDRIGAVAAIADQLASAFNAGLTLLRLKTQGQRNDVELLLFSEQYPSETDEAVRREIAESLLCSDDLSDLDINVSYPSRAGCRGPDPKPPVPSPVRAGHAHSPTGLVSLEKDYAEYSTAKILEARICEYTAIIKSSRDVVKVEDARTRLDAARFLLCQEGAEEIPLPRIFVSFDFEFRGLYDAIVHPVLERRRCVPVNGIDLRGRTIRQFLRDRIADSHGFIGVWKEKEKRRNHNIRFSDWLLWELGVAEASELPFLILSHTNVSKHHIERIPKQCVPFEDHNLKEVLEDCLPTFLDQVKDFEKNAAYWRHRMESLDSI
jgi:hypothetical protein